MDRQEEVVRQVQKELFEMQDQAYREFHSRLIPNVDPAKIIGVRTPQLRSYAKQYAKRPEAADFLRQLPHEYYEENNLHAFLIEQIKDYEACVAEWNRFLPYVDNWATCDILSPKVLRKRPEATLEAIQRWLGSTHSYTVRFGMEMLMSYYLDALFEPRFLAWVAADRSEEYYVRMMVAWFFATALAKQYEATLPYLEQWLLPEWTHKKTIQKACESYRITAEQKRYLRSLRDIR